MPSYKSSEIICWIQANSTYTQLTVPIYIYICIYIKNAIWRLTEQKGKGGNMQMREMWRKNKMLAPTWSPSPPRTARDPAATAGGSAYSAHASTELLSMLIYGPASVRKHKLEDLFKPSPTSWCLVIAVSAFFIFGGKKKQWGEKAAEWTFVMPLPPITPELSLQIQMLIHRK